MADLGATGRVIENPISGERIVIRTSAEDSDGALLSFDLYLPPGGHVPARHIHPNQEERFTIIMGEWRFKLGRKTILAAAGQTVVVPAGTAHWFGNSGGKTAQARVDVRPALRMEELLATNERLAHSARERDARQPRLRELALMLLEFQRELAVPFVPPGLARIVLRPLAWLGQRRQAGSCPQTLDP